MEITRRSKENPLLAPEDVKPSREGLYVEGVFNCGTAKYRNEVILLCRVAESVENSDASRVKLPVVKKKDGKDIIATVEICKAEHENYDYSDARSIWAFGRDGSRKIQYLTSLSHLRLARSADGIHFALEEQPAIFPLSDGEEWGMEDPRITQIGEEYYISYTAVGKNGAGTSLILTRDFEKFERLGMIFAPENKDVTIFPEKINGMYYALNRPVPFAIGTPDIWLAKSPDLLHWGGQKHFMGVCEDVEWINGRIGGGAVPVLTEKGWIVIYHAADKSNRYCLGALLLDKEDPSVILANTKRPILEPEEDYEKEGFFGNVVFTCGALREQDELLIYYGAADDKICRADVSLPELYRELGV